METWKPIEGWAYEISSEGRVRNLQGRFVRACVSGRHGHDLVTLYKPRKITRAVRSLVAEAFIGPRPDGHELQHVDGDRRNCRPSNLRYVPLAEGRRGRFPRLLGAANPNARLTPDDVREARRLAQEGWLQREIAAHLECSRSNVSNLLSGRTWTSVRGIR